MRAFSGLVIGFGLLLQSSAYAVTIHVDFGDVSPIASSNWNVIPTAADSSTPGLKDFATGSASAIGVTIANWFLESGDATNWIHGDKDWVENNAADDYIFVSELSASVTFTGLIEPEYSIEIVMAQAIENDGSVQVQGSFADRNFEGTPGATTLGDGWRTQTDGTVPGNWIIWDNVIPAGNQISIDFSPGAIGAEAQVNAIRLVSVPEPTSGLLVLVGLVGWTSRRRR